MSSSSSYSNSNNNPLNFVAEHDVFLSFRGEDTRSGFTSHLYDALVREGIKTFFDDDNLVRGKAISAGLMEAIQGSRSSVIVLSENYAFSGWCLTELCKIVECMDTSGLIVLPIFYHVNPSHVRKLIGSYRDAFKKHENNPKLDFEEVETWRDALKRVGNLAGWTLEETDVEAKFIKDFIADISSRLDIRKESPNEPARQSRLKDVPQISNDTSKGKNVINLTISEGKSFLSDVNSLTMMDASDAEERCNKEFDNLDSGSKALTLLKTHLQSPDGPDNVLSAVLAESRIPSCFTKRSLEPSISIEVNPDRYNSVWKGIALCVCFRQYPSNTLFCEMVGLDNHYYFQVGSLRFAPSCGESTSNSFNVWIMYFPLRYVPVEFLSNMITGDIKILFHNELLDQKSCFGQCGFRLVYEEDVNNLSFDESPNEREIWNDNSPHLLQDELPPNFMKSFQSLDISHPYVGGWAKNITPPNLMRGPWQNDNWWSYPEGDPVFSDSEYGHLLGPGMNFMF